MPPILRRKRRAKAFEVGREDLHAAGIDAVEPSFAADYVQRSAPFAAGFGERQRASGKIKRRQRIAAAEFRLRRLPVQAAGDHEVQDEP